MEGIVHDRDGDGHRDAWGIVWEKQGAFNQIVHYPLLNATPEEIAVYRFPLNESESLLRQMDPLVAATDDFFIGCDVSPCVFEMTFRLRGMENALLDLLTGGDDLLARCGDFSVQLAQSACQRFRLDWLWTGDDVASQQSMMMSPDVWRRMIKPHLQRVTAVGKSHNLPVAYHSCGAIADIIPDLIEIGVDVLNPIQSNCPGMEPERLKRDFGRHLTFMGGVDTQGLLPNGTPNEVRRQTSHLIETLADDGGGYILAASHTVPPETPDENLFALYEQAGVSREELFDRAADWRHRHQG
jgi:uroporphyrinogen decarboxylase